MIIKEKFIIDGREYSTIKLPVLRAIQLHARVMQAVGSGLMSSISSIDKNSTAAEVGTAVMGALLSSDLMTISEVVPEVLGEVFAADNRLQGAHLESYFNDFPQDLYPVAGWAIAVNIAPFFAGGGQGWKALTAHLGLKSPKDGGKPGSPVAR